MIPLELYRQQYPQQNDEELLCWASKVGHLHLVKTLCNTPVDIDHDENKALKNAITEGHCSIVQHLIECGATIDSDILFLAVEAGHQDIIACLLAQNVSIPNGLLEQAIQNDDDRTVQHLLNKSAVLTEECIALIRYSGNHQLHKFLPNNEGGEEDDDEEIVFDADLIPLLAALMVVPMIEDDVLFDADELLQEYL